MFLMAGGRREGGREGEREGGREGRKEGRDEGGREDGKGRGRRIKRGTKREERRVGGKWGHKYANYTCTKAAPHARTTQSVCVLRRHSSGVLSDSQNGQIRRHCSLNISKVGIPR